MENNKRQQLIERYFKAIGWEKIGEYQLRHKHPECDQWVYEEEYPDIIDHYPSFKKWVLERMEGERYKLDQVRGNVCRWLDESKHSKPRACYSEFIIDNEITLAAVEAATKYWESKNENI